MKELEVLDYAQLGVGGLTGAAAAFAAWLAKMLSLIWAVPVWGGAAFMFGAGVDGITAAASGLGAYFVEHPLVRGFLGMLTVGEIISGVHLAYLSFMEPAEASAAARATLKAMGIDEALKMTSSAESAWKLP